MINIDDLKLIKDSGIFKTYESLIKLNFGLMNKYNCLNYGYLWYFGETENKVKIDWIRNVLHNITSFQDTFEWSQDMENYNDQGIALDFELTKTKLTDLWYSLIGLYTEHNINPSKIFKYCFEESQTDDNIVDVTAFYEYCLIEKMDSLILSELIIKAIMDLKFGNNEDKIEMVLFNTSLYFFTLCYMNDFSMDELNIKFNQLLGDNQNGN